MLRAIDEGIWVAEDDNFIGPGTWFPVRMVVIRIGDGLWVLNPIPLEEIADAIETLGTVKWIVVPCGFHGSWAADAVSRWPDATLYASSAHERLGSKLPPWTPLESTVPAEWSGVLDTVLIEGSPKVRESVYLHRPTGTLLVSDLFFNIHESKAFLMPWILRLAGAWKRPMQSRLLRLFTKDRAAAGSSVRRMLAWNFKRAVPSHGDIVEDDAEAVVTEALHWMLGGTKALPDRATRAPRVGS